MWMIYQLKKIYGMDNLPTGFNKKKNQIIT